MENKRFERSVTNKVIGGVCAGLANYLNLDVSLMRVLFVVAAMCGSFGFWLYIILWIVAPPEQIQYNTPGQQENADMSPIRSEDANKNIQKSAFIVAIVLIVIGLATLVDNFVNINWIWKLWPLTLIALGVILIINTQNKQNNE